MLVLKLVKVLKQFKMIHKVSYYKKKEALEFMIENFKVFFSREKIKEDMCWVENHFCVLD